MVREKSYLEKIGSVLFVAVVIAGFSGFLQGVLAATSTNITSSVTVDNASPTVSAVSVNSGNSIILTANATTTIYVNFTVTDNNGCSDVFTSGNVTTTLFRAALTNACTASNANCYIVSTSTHNCAAGTSANGTSTFDVYYFAQATDASSSFASDDWDGFVVARDAANATSGASATNVELLTLLALNLTTSSISYGTLSASSTTGGTNQLVTSTNAGNSSTTLQLRASATLTSGSNSIATSSQRYSTSSFTFAGTSTALTDSNVTVPGFFLTAPTSTGNVLQLTYWGLTVPAGTATGTYSGTTVFSALFQP